MAISKEAKGLGMPWEKEPGYSLAGDCWQLDAAERELEGSPAHALVSLGRAGAQARESSQRTRRLV